MPTTVRDIISLAAKQAGVLGVGQTLLAEDINDCYTLLSMMMAQWQVRRWLVPALQDIAMLGNNNKSNTIGTGGYWNVARPNDIKGGYVIQQNTGALPVSLPLTKIFSYEDYIRIAVKTLNTLPDHFFYDGAFPFGNVFVWPIPSALYEIHLLIEVLLNFPLSDAGGATGLNTVYILPPEYQSAIHFNLALQICAMYQFPASDETKREAKVSLNTIRVNNTQVPTLSMPPGLKKGKAFNLFNADGY